MKISLVLMLLLVVGIVEAKVLASGKGVIGNVGEPVDVGEVTGEVSIAFVEETSKANPLMGIVIMFIINFIGLGIYALVTL